VARAGSATTLTLNVGKVAFGHEQAGRLSVTVAPQFAGSPGGQVTVKASSTTLCVITLTSAKGSCLLTARELKPGAYRLVASYAGSVNFAASHSATRALTVTK
jgi:hypothetical protein